MVREKELKVEDGEASHTLGGAGEGFPQQRLVTVGVAVVVCVMRCAHSQFQQLSWSNAANKVQGNGMVNNEVIFTACTYRAGTAQLALHDFTSMVAF